MQLVHSGGMWISYFDLGMKTVHQVQVQFTATGVSGSRICHE